MNDMPLKINLWRLILVGVLAIQFSCSGNLTWGQETTPPGLVAHWKLDELLPIANGMSVKDAQGKFTGEVKGAVLTEGKIGKALLFNGNQQYVEFPYHEDFKLSRFTVTAWVRLTDPPTYSGVLSTRHGGDYTFDLKVNADKTHGDIGTGTAWIETNVNVFSQDTGSNGQGGKLELNRWYHLAWVIDTDQHVCRLSIDADLKKKLPFQGMPLFMTPQQKLRIGNSHRTELMHGAIDDVRVFSSALSTQEVTELYTQTP